jgi:small nuclear ribonucleoprotein
VDIPSDNRKILLELRNSFKKELSLPSAMSLPLDVLEKAVSQKLLLLLKDGRHIEGKLLGYDEYMNLVLDEVEESKDETKRRLGRIILRGSNVVSISFV